MPRTPQAFRLTADLVAANAGASGIVALDASAEGRTYRLHAKRPDASLNRSARDALASMRGDVVYGPSGIGKVEPEAPPADVLLVSIDGPIEERAGWHDPCGGWSDGHDAIYERLAAAFEIGDVLLCGNTPGGAVSGGPEMMRRAQEMKAKHGRRCIGHTETCVASMGVWWFSAICDEVYVSPDAKYGSVGARAAHMSVADMLAREGVAPTFSAWPNDGKIAGVPELPLSETGKARMDRDVSIAGEMFAAAVIASPMATRSGLTRDAIVALGADALTGQAAVDAGLVDGVASLEDVMGYALATAGGGTAMDEDDKKDEGRAGDPPKNDGAKACGACGEMPGDKEARYCAKCGGKVNSAASEDDEPAPSSKPMPPKKEEGAAARRVPATVAASAGIAEIIGADPGASIPAQRTHAIGVRAVFDMCAKMTGEKHPDAIVGALHVIERDASNAGRYKRERDEERAKAETGARRDLAMRLIACDVEGWKRGDVFADVDGKQFTDAIGDMKIGTLRGMVERFEKNKAVRNPFTESREKAEAAEAANKPAAALASGEPTEAQIAAAMNLPAVKQLVAQTGRDPKTVATAYLKQKQVSA